MPVFLPLLEGADVATLSALSRLGPVLVHSTFDTDTSLATEHIVLVAPDVFDVDQVVGYLDKGASAVVISPTQVKGVADRVPRERLILLLDADSVSTISDKIRDAVSGVFLKSNHVDFKLLDSMASFFPGPDIYLWTTDVPQPQTIRELKSHRVTPVISTAHLTLNASDHASISIADAFTSVLVTDRVDGLYPTVVSSQLGRSLGLVYSSKASITETLTTGKGVYHSRKTGLWRKGETSGATQDVVKMTVDCDTDALEFRVVQHGSGFCHKGTLSCFGTDSGLGALECIIQSRFANAPEGSYTRRLFNDPGLLNDKIMEEAGELCAADSKEEVAFEAADLIYFALTRCISKGVTLADIERSLDEKALKVTRRPGNAKAHDSQPRAANGGRIAVANAASDRGDKVAMKRFDYKSLNAAGRSTLLKRPVLNSSTMIEKVRPIVNDIRERGDAALLELTARFDKVELPTPVLLAPFSPETMALDTVVKEAIDIAYDNIRRFHEAQMDQAPLHIETMPGVVCSRFSRPISSVGVYVPGGTAVLPSTALMLGVPAQVAGCKKIILATPPRSDGSISPEVMYVAHRVGASAILKAGGAQAVAALAYGTETVSKVDKIFGPGNQWVTAAKMLVQNDTDALVAIDMPAGPSEVLVIADETANPAFVAADLLSQAEHGVDSQVVLVALNLTAELLQEIEEQVDVQAKALPRFEIVKQSIKQSLIVEVASREAAIRFSNDYSPEHLIIHVRDAQELVSSVENAGSVFVGPWSPESCGDYASGTNHTLPTNGYAKQFSGVNTLSFQKHITSQEVTKTGLEKLGPVVMTLAECEGLRAHANAVKVRLAAE